MGVPLFLGKLKKTIRRIAFLCVFYLTNIIEKCRVRGGRKLCLYFFGKSDTYLLLIAIIEVEW